MFFTIKPKRNNSCSLLFMKCSLVILFIFFFSPLATITFGAESNYLLFPNLVSNSNFEHDVDENGIPDGWLRDPSAGISSTKPNVQKGLKSEKSLHIMADETAAWKSEVTGINPGHYYLLTFWVKREGIKYGKYPYLRIFGREIRMNELFSWGSWRKVAYLLKSDSRRKTTIAFLARRLSHGISFDRVFLKEFSFKKLRPANGKTVTGGKPHLSWKLPINHMVLRVTIDLSQYPLEPEHSSAKGIQIELMSPQGHGVRLYKTLYEGKWFWRLRAYLGREEVARSPVQVFQVESKNKTLGRLPFHIKLYSSQTPSSFFPIGIFTDNLKGIDELKQVGFNSVHHYLKYPDMLQKALEKLASVGMKALLTAPDTKEKTSFYNFVKKAAASQALLGWFMIDEPEGYGTFPEQIWKRSSLLRRANSFHPTALTLIRSRMALYYGPAADIILVDPYPIPTNPITWISDSIQNVHRALGSDKTVWTVIQAFNWKMEPHYPKSKPGRFPTPAEQRAMTFLAIANNAKGIFFFAEKRARKNLAYWNYLKKLAGELRCLYPLLTSKNAITQP
ncbi:MAG: hypothetical protein QGI11_11675, partial [Nitrospinota bacterium]|nr:hypothetical protein [Nitrospinota bacterium]